MFGIGAGELIIILIAGLVIFGPGKLPEVGRAIGKGLREFRKAQAAFSATLDEVSAEPKKRDDKVKLEKNSSENLSNEKKSEENVSAEKSAVNVDDVINMAKSNSFAKENIDEKVLNGNDTVANNSDVSKRVEPARSGTDSVGK
ncbi:MAG: twin-arginine translocase TatA/TatE family subunit [Selenomonadaceae bacterium]|nr:twin-arginine translocase TatA/TatE family subunit [Selenomonadaceae bacterium]